MGQASVFLWGTLVAALVACGSSEEGTGGMDGGAGSHAGGSGSSAGGTGGGSSSGGAAGATGGGGSTGGSTGGAAGAGGAMAGDSGPVSDADAAPKADADASGTGGGGQGGGDARGGSAGVGGNAGASAVDGGDSGVPAEASSPFSCLPNGEERLIIHIMGTPPLDVVNPTDALCLSRYLPANDDSGALLDFNWSIGTTTISAVVRLNDALPGQTGTFSPFAVLISQGADSWLGVQGKCHVSIAASSRIGTGTPAVYKVTGSLACDPEWALGKMSDVLQQFDFTTRVPGY